MHTRNVYMPNCNNSIDQILQQFFAVPENGQALQGMPDCKQLQLLTVNYKTTSDQQKELQINEQTKQDESKPKNSFKDNPYTNSEINQETC